MSDKDCPRAKSGMTPCVLRDGEICVTESYHGRHRICVGCGVPADPILAERGREP